jgi:uncharacterized protein YgiM (DUF1202 family)
MKKVFNLILLILASACLFAYEIEDFSDCEWFSENEMEYIIEYQTPYTSWYDIQNIRFPKKNNSDNYNDWGAYSINGIGGTAAIYSVSKEGANKFSFEYGWYPILEDDGNPVKSKNPSVCKVTIIDENTISLVNSPFGEQVTLHRKSYKSKNLAKGIVNDSNVRIRTAPNTNGTILGKLQTGTNVDIIKKSEISRADGVDNYWYQIQTEGYPICWIFGEYVTSLENEDEYKKIADLKDNIDKLPVMNGSDFVKKEGFADLFFDGTWCTEEQAKNLDKQQMYYRGSGLNEKAKAIKNDVCAIDINLVLVYGKSFSDPILITIHNTANVIESITYEGNSNYRFELDNSIVNIKIIDTKTIEITSGGKSEIWKRISYPYGENAKIARVCYDGVCLFSEPTVSEKEEYLNAGQFVAVLEKGEKQKIGDYEDYWYRVAVYNCVIENYDIEQWQSSYWIYGAFLEIVE